MGPPLIAAEDVFRFTARAMTRGELQWGRRSSRRKTRGSGRNPSSAITRFNGAAAHRGGRPAFGLKPIEAEGEASMGPPLIAAED